jgi:hypothetical protein
MRLDCFIVVFRYDVIVGGMGMHHGAPPFGKYRQRLLHQVKNPFSSMNSIPSEK